VINKIKNYIHQLLEINVSSVIKEEEYIKPIVFPSPLPKITIFKSKDSNKE